ncbi:MAG: hypothetical protein GDA41_01475 [Rhodospirillales bacterium]|nr:hypothetical protein [Rhodospirillales bacterium]
MLTIIKSFPELCIALSAATLLTGCGSDGDNGPGGFRPLAFEEFQERAIAAAGLPEEHEPQETAATQLMRAESDLGQLSSLDYIVFTGAFTSDLTRTGVTLSLPVDDETLRLEVSTEEEDLELEVSTEDLFGPSDDLESGAVLTKNGITLVRRSPGEDSGDRPLTHSLYGAWMDNAGFVVAVDGDFIVADGDDTRPIPGWVAASSGVAATSHPTANATWEGLMVGAIRRGDNRNQILQGDAELILDVSASTVDATFSEIYNLDKNAAHPGGSIEFTDVPLANTAGFRYDEDDGSLTGQFMGDGGDEVAGVFDRGDVIGAFGAKKAAD